MNTYAYSIWLIKTVALKSYKNMEITYNFDFVNPISLSSLHSPFSHWPSLAFSPIIQTVITQFCHPSSTSCSFPFPTTFPSSFPLPLPLSNPSFLLFFLPPASYILFPTTYYSPLPLYPLQIILNYSPSYLGSA